MPQAEFFDIFGSVGFLILLITGLYLRKKTKSAWVIIIISTLGLVVDSYIVITTFLLN